MRKFIDRLLGRTQPVAEAAPPGMQAAIERATQRAQRITHAKQDGLVVPVAQLADILAPHDAFDMLTRLRNEGTPLKLHSTADYDTGTSDDPVVERLVTDYANGEFSISHQRLNGMALKPHPLAPHDDYARYVAPVFTPLARLHGYIEGQQAYVLLEALSHPYGEVYRGKPEQNAFDSFRASRVQSELTPNYTVNKKVPPLPTPQDRAELFRRVDANRVFFRNLIG